MESITVQELAGARAEGAFVLDVRQPEEYAAGHVPGAVLIPLGEVLDRLSEIPRDEPIHVICRSGQRSATAARALGELGWRAFNVEGGTLAWIDAGLAVD